MNDLEQAPPVASADFGPKNGPKPAVGTPEALAEQERKATAARCDGVDRPSYFAAVEGLTAIDRSATTIASMFRYGNSASANQDLNELLRGIRSLSMLVALFAQVRRLDLDTYTYGGVSAADTIQQVATVLGALLAAQGAKDWSVTADTLQFELAPALRCWRPLVDSLAGRAA
jgi:hypothetical protein